MKGSWLVVPRMTIFGVLLVFSQMVHAEYYLEFPEPDIGQWWVYDGKAGHASRSSSKKHHHTAKKRTGHLSMQIYYVWPTCPSCSCQSYAGDCNYNDEQLNRRAVRDAYVTFHAMPTHDPARTIRSTETYDMRTSDDDVMRYPGMNNQY